MVHLKIKKMDACLILTRFRGLTRWRKNIFRTISLTKQLNPILALIKADERRCWIKKPKNQPLSAFIMAKNILCFAKYIVPKIKKPSSWLEEGF
jgi:hypothetical protein